MEQRIGASSLSWIILDRSSGNVNTYLQSVLRSAVAMSYEATCAGSRVAAVNAGEYVICSVNLGGNVMDRGWHGIRHNCQ